MQLSRYLKVFPAKDRPDHFLLYSTLRGSLVCVPARTLAACQSGDLETEEAATLERLGILVEDPEAEKEQMRGVIERANARSRRFSAVVVLNLDCNLNCDYCYEGEFRGNRYMDGATAQLVVDTMRDQMLRGLDVQLSFYGGEPLLSQGLIRRISEPLLEAAQRYRVSYSFSLITNGTLLSRDTALELLPLGLKGAKFTLDGPREIHDRQRPYASGAGSFDAIVANIEAIWDLLQIQLGGNFRQENYRAFPEMLDYLVARGVTPEKIPQVQFTPITPKAGCSEYGSECASSDEPWLAEALVYLRGEILSRGFATAKMGMSACVVELEHNMVIGHDGSLFKCPAFMGWPGLSIGTLAQGVTDYRVSHCVGNWQNDECLECCYLPLCFGGCRFLSLSRGSCLSEVDCRRGFLDATLESFLQQNLDHPVRPRQKSPAAAPETPELAAATGGSPA